MNGKIGSVDAGFQKVFIRIYVGKVFLELAWRAGKNQLFQFWNEWLYAGSF